LPVSFYGGFLDAAHKAHPSPKPLMWLGVGVISTRQRLVITKHVKRLKAAAIEKIRLVRIWLEDLTCELMQQASQSRRHYSLSECFRLHYDRVFGSVEADSAKEPVPRKYQVREKENDALLVGCRGRFHDHFGGLIGRDKLLDHVRVNLDPRANRCHRQGDNQEDVE